MITHVLFCTTSGREPPPLPGIGLTDKAWHHHPPRTSTRGLAWMAMYDDGRWQGPFLMPLSMRTEGPNGDFRPPFEFITRGKEGRDRVPSFSA
ncbi:MAG: hypothetical protein OXE76_04060 [Alphaproteobacteria bacterium]|nr:hypothetical protein [Alphaproteobacteria bacterium]